MFLTQMLDGRSCKYRSTYLEKNLKIAKTAKLIQNNIKGTGLLRKDNFQIIWGLQQKPTLICFFKVIRRYKMVRLFTGKGIYMCFNPSTSLRGLSRNVLFWLEQHSEHKGYKCTSYFLKIERSQQCHVLKSEHGRSKLSSMLFNTVFLVRRGRVSYNCVQKYVFLRNIMQRPSRFSVVALTFQKSPSF